MRPNEVDREGRGVPAMDPVVSPAAPGSAPSRLTDLDLHLFNEGTHYRLWEKLGAHPTAVEGKAGTYFAVWAPNARDVSVVGDFNGWQPGRAALRPRGQSGIWEGFVPGIGEGAVYKYHIESRLHGYRVDKTDPLATFREKPPNTASIVHGLGYEWGDGEWMAGRAKRKAVEAPISIYEVHLGSWLRSPDDPEGWLSYRDVAPKLAEYVKRQGFTHVELLPIMEHPFYPSWGYQTTGFFAPTSRYGTPQDFMYFVDHLHQQGIGVILDWVPSHFPTDEHGPIYFDGTHLYEHADPRQGMHPEWGSAIFNYGRPEVRSFLISSAFFWLEMYHADALRVDAVASMLYLDYARGAGEWVPNPRGGRENLEAVAFLQQLNAAVYGAFPGVFTVAEESTAWPLVSRPTYLGGLGFGFKWDMGWMHDTLDYFSREPVHRKFHHHELTFRSIYAFSENYVLPLSHDEVVHLKGSLLARMPGDTWQKFANLRLLLASMWAQPGKKLLFMGGEFGQGREWDFKRSLDWHQLEIPEHRGVQALVGRLNELYREMPGLHEMDCQPAGFQWLDANDGEQSVTAYLRKGRREGDVVLCVFNHTPVPRHGYRVGVPRMGPWHEVLNTDAKEYGGSGQGNLGGVEAEAVGSHGQPYSVAVTAPPLGAVYLAAPDQRGGARDS